MEELKLMKKKVAGLRAKRDETFNRMKEHEVRIIEKFYSKFDYHEPRIEWELSDKVIEELEKITGIEIKPYATREQSIDFYDYVIEPILSADEEFQRLKQADKEAFDEMMSAKSELSRLKNEIESETEEGKEERQMWEKQKAVKVAMFECKEKIFEHFKKWV